MQVNLIEWKLFLFLFHAQELQSNLMVLVAVSLIGQSAPPEVLQNYLHILSLDTILKSNESTQFVPIPSEFLYFVEIDIELPEDLPLKEAHAIGESLQIKIEELSEVERAFVHLDMSATTPEHSVLNRLPITLIIV
ncbi:hypothetical protein GH714_036825 [Hevea brasiliensis]|uniref:Cation efflux protein cytoplasmic domain-containing protein n=1 Tax=Hevea brasiliensis TaxID=3981 RepID=A0A6A6KKS0_HEVBR|nr:hypothetical protein GH714_036825 [Hevea brasiliensis]